MKWGSIYNYILIKYGGFLAWEKYERIAGIKTMVPDAGTDSLDTGAKKKVADYIFRHKRRRLPFMLNMQRKLILGYYRFAESDGAYPQRDFLLNVYLYAGSSDNGNFIYGFGF